ncbi:hypothetical protein IGI37_001835 [Enterococcus sp. AZ194]|uniref:hypothetical protein n=1 Tax=Enterococcus sp. AZ194 TaxID=2774629 RepID=UPI003F294B10
MKKTLFSCVTLMMGFSMAACSAKTERSKESQNTARSATQATNDSRSSTSKQVETQVTEETQTITSTTNGEKKMIDLSGTFYTAVGETSTIKSLGKNQWEIAYSTAEGDVTATFETKWKDSEQIKKSKTPMKKSDEYSGFNSIVEYISESEIKITMEDGNPRHEMVFTR